MVRGRAEVGGYRLCHRIDLLRWWLENKLRGRSVVGAWEALGLLRPLPISSFEIGSGAGAP